ncbi:uncharacterized protein LOC110397825 isoform X3 [Numida meleagris]|uniref:uncharacterized protein LOC110397825 isoform X3 n=1 Tax=Numida meleagris TaxID=8996 RepID=UPI000B3DF1C1|nr:uncharacterized protein LOC110397825 isoform X3 [Numida meleagris]
MEDAMRKPVHSKPPVSLGMYRSMHKKDYTWQEEIKPPTEEDIQKLRANEFAVPQEPRAMTYYDKAVGEGREVTQKSHAPRCYSTPELTASQAERLERPWTLSGLEKDLSSSQHLQAAAGGPSAAGMLLYRQKLDPTFGTYQHFMLETGQALQHEAQQNKNMALRSSVLVEDCFNLDRSSTYSTDFQRQPAAYSGCCTANKNVSHVFTEDQHFHQNRWVSEYKDNYSIHLHRLNWASQGPAAELHSALKPQGPSSQSEVAPDTAQ